MKKLLLLLCLSGIFITSCKKYPEGPSLTFRSAAGRLERKWGVEKIIENGKEKTLTADDLAEVAEFKSDKTFSFTLSGLSFNGKWEFSSDKNTLTITLDPIFGQTQAPDIWTIKKLTSSEFWFTQTNGTSTDETHFKAK